MMRQLQDGYRGAQPILWQTDIFPSDDGCRGLRHDRRHPDYEHAKLLNYIVASYLIVVGLIGPFGLSIWSSVSTSVYESLRHVVPAGEFPESSPVEPVIFPASLNGHLREVRPATAGPVSQPRSARMAMFDRVRTGAHFLL
jgi:hypothetical protein